MHLQSHLPRRDHTASEFWPPRAQVIQHILVLMARINVNEVEVSVFEVTGRSYGQIAKTRNSRHVMSSTAATSVTAEAEQLPRKGPRKGAATPAVATSDRLRNRERQSLAQATQLAAKLYLASPGSVYAVKHVVTSRKSTSTHIIFNRRAPAGACRKQRR